MDVFNFARTAEQIVYEAVSWLYFYPATLLRVLFRPVKMMEYAGEQTDAPEDSAFIGAMRPALLLFLSIVLGATVVPLQDTELKMAPKFLQDSWLHLIGLRFIAFGLYPMAGAIICDLFTPGEVTRQTLKKPFNQQAYIYAPFALIVSPLFVVSGRFSASSADYAIYALLAILGMYVWAIFVQVAFFRRNVGFSFPRSIGAAITTVLLGASMNVILWKGISQFGG